MTTRAPRPRKVPDPSTRYFDPNWAPPPPAEGMRWLFTGEPLMWREVPIEPSPVAARPLPTHVAPVDLLRLQLAASQVEVASLRLELAQVRRADVNRSLRETYRLAGNEPIHPDTGAITR